MDFKFTTGKLILNYGEKNEIVLGEITTPTPEPPKLYKCFCTTCCIYFESDCSYSNVCINCFNKYTNSGVK